MGSVKTLKNLREKIEKLESEKADLVLEIDGLRKAGEEKADALEEEVVALRKEADSLKKLLDSL